MTKKHMHLECSLRSHKKGYTWECLVCQYTILFTKNLQLDQTQGAYYMTLSKCKSNWQLPGCTLAVATPVHTLNLCKTCLKNSSKMLWQLWFGCKLCTLSFGWLHSHSSSFSLLSSLSFFLVFWLLKFLAHIQLTDIFLLALQPDGISLCQFQG